MALVAFVLLNLGLQLAMTSLDVPGDYGKQWGDELVGAKAFRLERLEKRGGVSMLFLGASLVDAAVDPEVVNRSLGLGRPAFVAGSNGATPALLDLWSSALVTFTRPDVVVLGLGPNDLVGASSSREIQMRESPGFRSALGDVPCTGRKCRWSAAMRRLERSARRLPVVRWRWNVREVKFGLPMTSLGHDTVFEHGRMIATTPAIAPAPRTVAPITLSVPAENETHLRNIVRRHRELGATVVLVRMPISATTATANGGGQPEGYVDFLERVARDEQALVVQVDDRLGFDDRYFADGLHTNADGTRAFSEAFAAALETQAPELLARLTSAEQRAGR